MPYTRNDLLFLGRMNIRYHENRERYYELFINWTAFASVLLSSAAILSLMPLLPPQWQFLKDAILPIAASIVAGLNAAVLAMGMFNKFTVHSDLKKQWIAFLSRLDRAEVESDMKEFEQALHDLCAREPAADQKLLKLAEAQTKEALGWQ